MGECFTHGFANWTKDLETFHLIFMYRYAKIICSTHLEITIWFRKCPLDYHKQNIRRATYVI